MRILTCYNNIMHPGIAKLVSRLVWDQETVRSSRTTRTKSPLKSWISEGFFLSLITAAQNLSRLTLSIYTGDCLGLSPQRRCPHRQAAVEGTPCNSG